MTGTADRLRISEEHLAATASTLAAAAAHVAFDAAELGAHDDAIGRAEVAAELDAVVARQVLRSRAGADELRRLAQVTRATGDRLLEQDAAIAGATTR